MPNSDWASEGEPREGRRVKVKAVERADDNSVGTLMDRPSIQARLKQLNEMVEISHQAVGELEARIGAVLVPELEGGSPDRASDGRVMREPESDMMVSLTSITLRMTQLIERVHTIKHRVEL